MSCTIWIDSRTENASGILAQNMRHLIENVNIYRKPVAFVCIGSSLVNGDNLGPLIGTVLTRYYFHPVYGTMETPLNAQTLLTQLPLLKQLKNSYFIIAVDASIGAVSQKGYITLSDQPLFPGAGVAKHLPAVGDLHITGVFDSLDSSSSRQLLPPLCRQISLGLLRTIK
jgi:putative sporulation protein YyaC